MANEQYKYWVKDKNIVKYIFRTKKSVIQIKTKRKRYPKENFREKVWEKNHNLEQKTKMKSNKKSKEHQQPTRKLEISMKWEISYQRRKEKRGLVFWAIISFFFFARHVHHFVDSVCEFRNVFLPAPWPMSTNNALLHNSKTPRVLLRMQLCIVNYRYLFHIASRRTVTKLQVCCIRISCMQNCKSQRLQLEELELRT